jgi:hypothetical protein
MRNVILILILAALVATGASVVQAQPPINDPDYSSTDGDMLEGRSSTSWSTSTGVLAQGNVLNIMSFDGANLGTEWRFYCMQIVNVVPLYDTTVGGTGFKAWLVTYVGGLFWLDGAGMWGGGDADYTGVLSTFTETRIEQYLSGALVGDASDYSLSGVFNNYSSSCLSLIANDAIVGNTDTTNGMGNFVKPGDYPGFLDAACAPTGQYGRWGDTTDLTMSITGCAVPVEDASWGQVKSLYTE